MGGNDWFDDYMEMQLATGEDDDSGNSGGSDYTGCLPVFLGFLLFLWVLSLLVKVF